MRRQFLARQHFIVKFGNGTVIVSGDKTHRRSRMAVEEAGNHVGKVESPFQGSLQGLNAVLDAFQNRTQFVLRIVQESEDQFNGTIPGAASQSAHAGVNHVGPENDSFDTVGIGQL